MPTIPLSGAETHEIIGQRLRPVPSDTPWRYRVAVPFIMMLSVALWAVVWEAASYTAAIIMK